MALIPMPRRNGRCHLSVLFSQPCISVGNVGQLTVDLIINSLKLDRVGYLQDPALLPLVGNDAFDHTTHAGQGHLHTAAEGGCTYTHKVGVSTHPQGGCIYTPTRWVYHHTHTRWVYLHTHKVGVPTHPQGGCTYRSKCMEYTHLHSLDTGGRGSNE